MKKKTAHRSRSTRRRPRAGFATAGLLLVSAPAALAQTPSCTDSGGACTIPAGNYNQPYQVRIDLSSALTFTNNGTINVAQTQTTGVFGALVRNSLGAPGASESDSTGGNAGSVGSLTFQNNGAVTQTISLASIHGGLANAVYAASIGGDGGNYTGTNGKHDGGSGSPGGAASLTNTASVRVSVPGLNSGSVLYSGAAVLVESVGGNGGNVASEGPDENGNPKYHTANGQPGTGGGAVTLTNSGAVSANLGTALVSTGYWGIGARSLGGNGGTGNNGTAGGGAGTASVSTTADVSVTMVWGAASGGDRLATPGAFAVHARSQGGNGNMSVNSGNDGGAGGTASASSVTVGPASGAPAGTNLYISLGTGNSSGLTTTPQSAAIAAVSLGGNGGAGYDHSTGGTGGGAGAVSVTVSNSIVSANGDRTLGILGLAQGGIGGDSGIGQDHSRSGDGGSTGLHSDTPPSVQVSLTGTTVTTSGALSPGVVGASLGGAGGTGTVYTQALWDGEAAWGGGGGNTGPVQMTINGGSVRTTGEQSPGVVAIAQGGVGGDGGGLNAAAGGSGTGGSGGQGAPVTVNIGAGTVISTSGGPSTTGANPSYGVYAASIGGQGGKGGYVNVDFAGGRGDGGYGGGGYNVQVSLAAGASVSTSGSGASAVFALSFGGGGGSAYDSSASGFVSTDGTGGAGGNSGTVTVTNAAALTTSGTDAHGILAQSIGGLSGNGANGAGALYGPAGGAGAAGTAGAVSVTNTGTILTTGSGGIGIQAQSIGGGTGSGGSQNGAFVAFGGSAPAAAAGGTVSVSNSGAITTRGDYALGILTQSIGGGGGNAGSATGVFGSVGGNGGAGGDGGAPTLTLTTGSAITTQGRLAHGAVVQSIGGGGGNGGDANSAGVVETMAIGGSGGSGGKGGTVALNVTGGSISLSGSNSIGMVAQSIGGGGGTGGTAYSTSVSLALAAAHAVGGSGGTGGDGGSVTLGISGLSISTGQATATSTTTTTSTNLNPVDAYGIVAQSIGGGGGIAGSATANAVAIGVPLPETEGNTVAVSVAHATGGSGGSAGNGGAVSLTLSGSGPTSNTITTQGQGSHGVVLQSIGGGGGAGGDSSAMAATISYGRVLTEAGKYEPPGDAEAPDGPNSFSLDISVSHGGKGSSGGAGGSVTAAIDSSTITTFGDYANAVLAQSIGGGGGNGGVGSSTTEALGSTRSATVTLGLGGQGGNGGNGGAVSLTINPNAVIQTYGASALGIVGQSIGGGGGTSQGGTINLGGAYTAGNGTTVTPSGSVTVNLGRTGGAGGAGGTIRTVMQGRVLTSGSDSAGVVLQSIGGGGGIGGSAGAEASSDNPISTLTGIREALNNPIENNVPINFSGTLSIGGRGGGGGNGSTVTYSQAGSIATKGDWSHGLVAQSIGAGGGMGGLATSSSSVFGFSSNISLGGYGGAGGSGGAISLTFAQGSSISTGATTSGSSTGYGAFGVLAQSIGGGGGTGVDGSIASSLTINVGSTKGGGGGSGGNGNQVHIMGTTNITTLGDVGVGMVLQSIGGGGGVGASGTSLSARAGVFSGSTQIHVGGTSGAPGSSGQVFVDNATLNIRTSGANAYGILAQSIGGGGGFGFAPSLTSTVTNTVGGTAAQSGMSQGGSVTLNLVGGSIQTSGMGAHGIVAQSIGGGGGIAGVPTGAASLTTVHAGGTPSSPNSSSTGLSITSSAPITTTGDFAYGILAQSLGGGGGIYVQNGTQVFAGDTANNANYAGPVLITQTAPITVSGANSVGIFGQTGGSLNASAVNVTVSAAIQGGSGAKGYGVWIDTNNPTSLLWVQEGGSVSALSGNAILMTAGSVQNDGQISGSYSVGGVVTNTGTINAGQSLVATELVNTGTVLVAAHAPYGVSRVGGNFTQLARGRLVFDADFAGRRSDTLVVDGAARLDGRVRPLAASLLPNVELPFLVVNGTTAGSLQGDRTTLFDYQVTQKGGTFTVSARADFTPDSFRLPRNQAAVASHLQSAWDSGGSPALAPFFAMLGNTAETGGEAAYRAALRQTSPNSSFAPGARVAANAQAFANSAMSCPQFQGTTAMLVEGNCVWVRFTGRTASQSAHDGLTSFSLSSNTWQLGGQQSLGGGWFLGGSLAYESSRLSGGDGLNSGRGTAGFGAVTVKYQTGPWLFAGAVFGGGGEFDNSRVINLPGFGSVARGSPGLSNVGGMLRANYTVGREEFYLRPSMSLSVIHARSSGYRETGAGALNLDVSSASSTVGALTPAVEVGGRAVLGHGMVGRLFASAGVSFLTQGDWNQASRLMSAPAGTGNFSTTVRTDQVVGRVTVGAQLFATDRVELRAQYDGEYSSHLTGHGGSLTAAFRF